MTMILIIIIGVYLVVKVILLDVILICFLINIIIYVLIVIMISIGSLKKNIMDILYLLKLRIGIILMTMIYCI